MNKFKNKNFNTVIYIKEFAELSNFFRNLKLLISNYNFIYKNIYFAQKKLYKPYEYNF